MPVPGPRPPVAGLEHAAILYGWREVQQYLRRGKTTVRRWHKRRRMPIAFLGHSLVIPRAALDLWVMDGKVRPRDRVREYEEYERERGG